MSIDHIKVDGFKNNSGLWNDAKLFKNILHAMDQSGILRFDWRDENSSYTTYLCNGQEMTIWTSSAERRS